jgi:hypothetical protein
MYYYAIPTAINEMFSKITLTVKCWNLHTAVHIMSGFVSAVKWQVPTSKMRRMNG